MRALQHIRRTLKGELGAAWLPFFLRCLLKKRAIFRKTHWAREESAESRFVKRLALASALFVELSKRVGESRAADVMEELLVPVGCAEQWHHLRSLPTTARTPMERLMAFNDLMDRRGAPRFNRREYIEQGGAVCHFIITRCLLADFFNEAGTPILTRAFCRVDREFFPEAFPEFDFHRDGSWENTIAYGRDLCEFVFELKGHRSTHETPYPGPGN
jgi:hypothetical protein